jgi:hypothetical protein
VNKHRPAGHQPTKTDRRARKEQQRQCHGCGLGSRKSNPDRIVKDPADK